MEVEVAIRMQGCYPLSKTKQNDMKASMKLMAFMAAALLSLTADGKYRLPYCDHAIIPHLKSENLRVMETYEREILASLSRFRESRNLTWLIYPLHLSREGRHEGSPLRSRYHALYNEECIRNINFGGCDVITLNDEYGGNFYYGKTLLGKMLEAILPGKSEFEIL